MTAEVIIGLPDLGIKPYYSDKWRAIYLGDCREIAQFLAGVVSAVVTDPPYELGFMGKSWDSKGVSFQPVTWSIIRRSCKPGAMMLAFGGTRTFHRIAVAIEDAGWEIRDTVMWVYGSGFPKSMDISKAIDKANGNERTEIIGERHRNVKPFDDANGWNPNNTTGDFQYKAPATPESAIWNGWGTALKPAWEPIILSMNPVDGTFVGNALRYGVAGLNIDGCRVAFQNDADKKQATVPQPNFNSPTGEIYNFKTGEGRNGDTYDPSKGRFPANLIHDGSDEVMAEFPVTGGGGKPQQRERNMTNPVNFTSSSRPEYTLYPDTFNGGGSTARFFYCAKASRSERNSGRDGNNHPTVKPIALMEYLCKLVKMPQYNLILDPFCGSGSTLLACTAVGVHSVGIDSDEKSCDIVAARCSADAIKRIREGTY